MVAGGIHLPDDVVEAEREPGEGDPVAHQRGAEHPPDLRPREPPIALVLVQIDVVVPFDESVPERRQEDEKRNQGERQRDEPWADAAHSERSRKRGQIVLGRARRSACGDLDALDPRHDSPLNPQCVNRILGLLRAQTRAREGISFPCAMRRRSVTAARR